jgi:hypothetical protein
MIFLLAISKAGLSGLIPLLTALTKSLSVTIPTILSFSFRTAELTEFSSIASAILLNLIELNYAFSKK